MMNKKQFDEKAQTLREHYLHACKKHPFFADSIIYPLGNRYEGSDQKFAIANRKRNKAIAALWQGMVKSRKEAIQSNPTVDNVLTAELYEIWTAIALGDMAQARSEIYDAMAVLLRLDENLEELYQSSQTRFIPIPGGAK